MQHIDTISGMITDVAARRIFGGTIHINNGMISSVEEDGKTYDRYILPGFTDAHIHIESSMLTPYEFARIALLHGTVSTVSDPHEIGNVCGMDGVLYMIENARGAGLKFHFGAPSCVPATTYETAGALLDEFQVEQLLQRSDIYYLSEMMNYPGVLNDDKMVKSKIAAAVKAGKPVDGHAPGLRGKDAEKYAAAGITTDHECFTIEEALDKLACGMKILIREGSAARNFDALIPLLKEHWKNCMFCCDDKHPDELLTGHINLHVRKAVALGYNVMDVLNCACVNPVVHYKMKTGLLHAGDAADFIVTENLRDFTISQTVIDGILYAKDGKCFLPERPSKIINNFKTDFKDPAQFKIKCEAETIKVIQVLDGQLITKSFEYPCKVQNGYAVSSPEDDILLLTVVNRYSNEKPAMAFIRGFNIKNGAFASSIAHDSHNIIAVGTDEDNLCEAVNQVIGNKGGLSVTGNNNKFSIALPVAGLMSDKDGFETASAYSSLDKAVKDLGCNLRAPFMSLSFMALLVIPELKLSDQGLFDGGKFSFAELFI